MTVTTRRALITGASGHLGGALAHRLLADGVRVFGTTRVRRGDDAVEFLVGDIADYRFTSECLAVAQPDTVFHMAGEVTGSRSVSAVLPTYHSLLTSTVNLMVAAQEHGSPAMVLAGSLEDSLGAATPASPYAAAKETARLYAAMFHKLYGARTVTARIFMVYGPGPQNDNRFIPYVVRSLQQDTAMSLSSGRRPVDWVYIDDVVEGLVALASSPGAFGRTVDLGTGRPHTVRHVGERIRDLIGSTTELPWGTLEDRPYERVAVADPSVALDLCGWRPTTTLDVGLARTVAWFSDHSA